MMKIEAFPTREELEQHASLMPEINPPAVLAMLRIMQAAEEIRCDINDVLEKNISSAKVNCGSSSSCTSIRKALHRVTWQKRRE